MFVRNCWYAAAWDHELGREPLARTFLNEPVVMFRGTDGTPIALADRCCHRGLPLSLGRLEGDLIRCGYHGLVFDRTGSCVEVPGQSTVPPGATVQAYPMVERHHLVWIWMGDPALAEESEIVDFRWMDEPYKFKGERIYVKANYQLMVDNLLDLSHLTYLHPSTVGVPELAERAKVSTEFEDDRVLVTRWTLDVSPPPMFRAFGGIDDNVDIWQISRFNAPSFFDINNGMALAGTGAPEGIENPAQRRWGFHPCHGITPETETSTHDFWSMTYAFEFASPAQLEKWYQDAKGIVREDIAAIEAVQRVLDSRPDAPAVDINYDAGPLAARRAVDRLLQDEAAADGATAAA